jgi:exosome complex RNA-binding protein Csl4
MITEKSYLDAQMIIKDYERQQLNISDVIESVCPECSEPLIEKWSGVKCSKCDYWECY